MQQGTGGFFEKLERDLRASSYDPRVPAALAILAALRRELEADWRVRRFAELLTVRDELREARRRTAAPKTIIVKRPRGLPFRVRFEPARIHAALKASSHNIAAAAKVLGCSRQTVYNFKHRKSNAVALDTRDTFDDPSFNESPRSERDHNSSKSESQRE